MRHKVFRSSWVTGVLALALAIPHGVLIRAQAAPTQAKPTTTAKPAAQPSAAVNPPPWHQRGHGLAAHGRAQERHRDLVSAAGRKLDRTRSNIVAWSAVSYQPTGAKEPALGTIKIEGPTQVSVDDRVVSLDLQITEYNFKTLSPEQVKTLVAEVQARPQNERVIDLDRVLGVREPTARCRSSNVEGIKADPPKIFWAPAPAILVNLDGDPIWSPIKDLDLRYARQHELGSLRAHAEQDVLPARQRSRGCRPRR